MRGDDASNATHVGRATTREQLDTRRLVGLNFLYMPFNSLGGREVYISIDLKRYSLTANVSINYNTGHTIS